MKKKIGKTQLDKQITKVSELSNREKVFDIIYHFPGLRFFELKKETGFPNGTLQHHINSLIKKEQINSYYDNAVPRYFTSDIEQSTQSVITRLNQNTTSKIIKLLLKKECQTFPQMVKYTRKTPGTVSIYKNKLIQDKIIIGRTEGCKSCKNYDMKIKYRLINPEKIRTLVEEYGKTSLTKTADNLADIFLAIK